MRYINTRFWDDNYITELSPEEKLLFLYFLTNPLTTIAGIYEISLKRIEYDTGIIKQNILKIIRKFEKANKVFYIDNNWIFLKNFIKNQSINPKIKIGIQERLNEIPTFIIDKIKEIDKDSLYIAYDSLSKPTIYSNSNSNSNLNLNLNSNKKEIVVSKETPSQIVKSFLSNPEEMIQFLIGKGIDRQFVDREIRKFISYWTEPNKSGTKQRWELQKTFELKRRLNTWFSNNQKFEKNNQPKIAKI